MDIVNRFVLIGSQQGVDKVGRDASAALSKVTAAAKTTQAAVGGATKSMESLADQAKEVGSSARGMQSLTAHARQAKTAVQDLGRIQQTLQHTMQQAQRRQSSPRPSPLPMRAVSPPPLPLSRAAPAAARSIPSLASLAAAAMASPSTSGTAPSGAPIMDPYLFGGGGGSGRGGSRGFGGGGFGGGSSGGGGAFGQGFLQGALPESFIQRGPGALQQAAGVGVGRMLRGAGSALSSGLSGDLGGVVSGLNGIPLVGGTLAGMLNTGFQRADMELGYQRNIGQMAPSLGGIGSSYGSNRALGDGLAGMGQGFGLDKMQTAMALSQATSQGGGSVAGLNAGQQQQILAAQQLGLGGGNSAALIQGSRQGAVVGADNGTALSNRLAHAIKMGFDSSQQAEYMNQMAADIAAFRSSGIPLAPESMDKLTEGLATQGINPLRADAVGRNMMAMGQNVSNNGPQDALQTAMLRYAGYTPGDVGSYTSASMKLGDAKWKGDNMSGMLDSLLNGKQYFGNLNELGKARIYQQITGGSFNEGIGYARGQNRGPLQGANVDDATAINAAQGMIGGGVGRQAAISNVEYGQGASGYLDAKQGLQESVNAMFSGSTEIMKDASQAFLKSFDLAKTGAEAMGGAMETVATKLLDIAEHLGWIDYGVQR